MASRARPFNRGSWEEQLRWGLDQFAEACRLLSIGHTIGAVVYTRNQLERWTHNVANHHNVDQRAGETTADYFRRVWAVYPPITEMIDLGQAWKELSETLHGRGSGAAALSFECGVGNLGGTRTGISEEFRSFYAMLATVLDVTSRQVRGGISVLADERGLHGLAHGLQSAGPPAEDSERPPIEVASMAPLDFFIIQSQFATQLVDNGRRYRRTVGNASVARKLERATDWDLARDALLERRGRAIERARKAYEHEAETLGEAFNPEQLAARLYRYIAISEAAAVVGDWVDGPASMAMMSASAALRSAWVIWLEDTDMSLPCIRTVLEQTCRARAWRIKPNRASRVEQAGAAAAPVRWAEAAGWGRLAVISRALGEFAHVNVRARWSGARDLLIAVQRDEGSDGAQTARGHALDAAAYLLAHETAARLEVAGPAVVDAFREAVTLLPDDQHQSVVDELLDKALSLRGFSFGTPDLEPIGDAGE